MLCKVIREGESRLIIPLASIPEDREVFYHEAQALARDFSILVYSSLVKEVFDSMSATGARAVRLAKYGIDVVANDVSKRAVSLIKINAEINGLDFPVLNKKAEVIFHEKMFEAIDLDPFGSPAPFLHCALRGAKKVIGVTATDTSSFEGTYPRVSRRRYWLKIRRLSNYREVGLRAFIGFVIREAAKLEIAAQPVFAHVFRHYYRAYFLLRKGASRVDRLLKSIGTYKDVGPLWLGSLWDQDLLEKMAKKKITFGHRESRKILELIRQEAKYQHNFYVNIHALCRELKVSPPPISKLLEEIEGTRTHFDPLGIRTKLGEEELKEVLRWITKS